MDALRRGIIIDLMIITLVWAIGCIVVNPSGEFPLIDDWSYSKAVMNLVETGDYRPLGWAVMSLFTHVLWGTLFTIPAGFSFTALRISMVVAGLLGLFGTYILVRDLPQPRWIALAIAGCVGFYPAYLMLSYTFMTDVSFAAMAIWSVVFFARSVRSGSIAQLVVGTLFAISATLARQLGLAIPLAFSIVLLLRPGLSKQKALHAIVPLIACVVVFLTYNYWLEVTHRAPMQYTQVSADPLQHTHSIQSLLHNISIFAFFTPQYVGLFIMPIFLFGAWRLLWFEEMTLLWRRHFKLAAFLCGIAVGTMAWAAVHLTQLGYPLYWPMPVTGNVLGKLGFGPFSSLRDLRELPLDHDVVAVPAAFWVLTTTIGLAGAALLIAKTSVHAASVIERMLYRREAISDNELINAFLFLCAGIYLLPFISWGFFDRYLILLLPLLAAAVVGSSGTVIEDSNKAPRVAGATLIALFGVMAISGTRDHQMWNRVRWQALRELMQERQLDANDIDGGAEFNAWYLYDENYTPQREKSPWWVNRDTYQIGFRAFPGFKVIKTYTYQHWFPPHEQQVVVMQKLDETPTP